MKFRIVTANEKARLIEFIRYNKSLGKLYWAKKAGPNSVVGEEAGFLVVGYRRFILGGKLYFAHRVIWFFERGDFPPNQVDHIDGNKLNNLISNLRCVSGRQNQQNRKSHRNGKLVGTKKRSWGWASQITIKGKSKHLGTFKSELAAHKAYMKAVKELVKNGDG